MERNYGRGKGIINNGSTKTHWWQKPSLVLHLRCFKRHLGGSNLLENYR